jgi:large repetitive protein
VHSGKSGARVLTLTGEGPGEGFGTSASVAGDLDGDGHADLAVGAWQYAGAAPSGGRIYLYSGKDGRLLRTITCRIPGDTLGFDSVGVGDTDGDGTVDLLVTSAYSGINGYHSGRVFIVSSGIQR